MDPAAIGTALIGLDAVHRQSDEAPARTTRLRPRHGHLATTRNAVAAVLRTLANALEARPREPARGS
jgi:hypothetical protein